MRKLKCLLIISLIASQTYAKSWSGTSRTSGSTTYHEFHDNEITVLPAPERSHNNTGAFIGVAIIGLCVGALLVKALQNNQPQHKKHHHCQCKPCCKKYPCHQRAPCSR